MDSLDPKRGLHRPHASGVKGLDETTLMESSLARLVAKDTAFADLFFERLFQRYPAIRPLFRQDLSSTKRSLLDSLGFMGQNLRTPAQLAQVLMELGKRHARYQVRPLHFDAFGENLMAVVAEIEGTLWTPHLERAWQKTYSQIAQIMRNGLKRGDV